MVQSTLFHGALRGADVPKRSSQFEGRFGRMFRSLPPAEFSAKDLQALAASDVMLSQPELSEDKQRPSATPENELDIEENFDIPAGYTYVGQFIDHDITFDPVSQLDRLNDPDALTDFRTPRLDLDSLYGRGPLDQPYLYDMGNPRRAAKFALGRPLTYGHHPSPAHDLPRLNGHAVIGDKRNDENVIISQFHGAMLKFHNAMVDALPAGTPFDKVAQQVRWHYQYAVINDFVRRICGDAVLEDVLPHFRRGRSIFDAPPRLHFYSWRNDAFMPIEFSAAAYRFGHSMVRPIYRLNKVLDLGGPAVGEEPALQGRHLIFAGVSARALNGFREFPAEWGIDWSLFFGVPDRRASHQGKSRVQPSYKIDASLVNPLGFLPEFSEQPSAEDRVTLENFQAKPVAGQRPNLALRNLMRGMAMGLPSGQDVARAMGLPAWDGQRLLIGKAAYEDGKLQAKRLDEVAPNLSRCTPLWAYVLAEATTQWHDEVTAAKLKPEAANQVGTRLGPVGARLVAETLVGLILADSHSFLAQDPNWVPTAGSARENFGFDSILQVAGLL
ncbi:MAG: heme peroxidase [Burkholderiales bacterium]|nr:MAG: heme peroxidase [Burkholderiales bacterium]